MIYVWRVLMFLFLVSIPAWYVPVIIWDLAHPEVWDSDWMHDPRIYGPGFAVVAALGMLMALHIYWTERRRR